MEWSRNGRNILVDSEKVCWIIDFPFSGHSHSLKDIAKFWTSCLLEYTPFEGKGDFDAALRMMVELALDENAYGVKAELPDFEVSKPLRLFLSCTERLFFFGRRFCGSAISFKRQLFIATTANLLRALSFRDLRPLSRAMCISLIIVNAAVLSNDRAGLDRLRAFLASSTEGSGVIRRLKSRKMETDLSFLAELEMYKRRLRHRFSFLVDPISRKILSLMEHTVSPQYVEILPTERIPAFVSNDAFQQYEGDALFSNSVQSFFPSTVNVRKDRRLLLLGTAGFGKSLALKKMALTACLIHSTTAPVPVFIEVVELARFLENLHGKQAKTADLLDAYLIHKHGNGSNRLAMLRRARSQHLLMVLIDGLDESSPSTRDRILKFTCPDKCTKHDFNMRIIISSRPSGLLLDRFFSKAYKVLRIQPLTKKKALEMAKKRDPALDAAIARALSTNQFREFTTSPLLLSLLIFALQQPKSSTTLTKRTIFTLGIKQMLFRLEAVRRARRMRKNDRASKQNLDLLNSPACMSFVRMLSWYAHRNRLRDLTPKDLKTVAAQANAKAVLDALLFQIANGRVPLFQAELKKSHSRSVKDLKTIRISHLSFQEHLAGEFCADKLMTCNDPEDMQNCAKDLFSDDDKISKKTQSGAFNRLADMWYQPVMTATLQALLEGADAGYANDARDDAVAGSERQSSLQSIVSVSTQGSALSYIRDKGGYKCVEYILEAICDNESPVLAKGSIVEARPNMHKTIFWPAKIDSIVFQRRRKNAKMFKSLDVQYLNGRMESGKHLRPSSIRIHAPGGSHGLMRAAAASGCRPVVTSLIKRGVCVCAVDGGKETPLHHAVRAGHAKIVKVLKAAGGYSSFALNARLETPADLAREAGRKDILRLLIPLPGDIDATRCRASLSLAASHQSAINEIIQWIKRRENFRRDDCRTLGLLLKRARFTPKELDKRINKSGMTILMLACKHGSAGLIKRLLKLGANPFLRSLHQWNVYHFAAASGNTNTLRLLLSHRRGEKRGSKEKGVIDSADTKGKSPLHYAAQFGFASCVELLLQHGASAHATDNDGWNAMMLAARNNEVEAMHALVEHVRVNFASPSNYTALHAAAYNENIDAVRFLIARGADVNAKRSDGATSLMLVSMRASNNAEEVINELIKAGARMHDEDANGDNCFAFACLNGKLEAVKVLMRHATFDVNHKNKRGTTPIIWSAQRNHPGVLNYLIVECSGNIDAKETDGWSALHHACRNNHVDCVRLLLQHGADINAKTVHSYTSLMTASYNGSCEAVMALLNHKRDALDMDASDEAQDTALIIAKKKGHVQIATLLEAESANRNKKREDRKRRTSSWSPWRKSSAPPREATEAESTSSSACIVC